MRVSTQQFYFQNSQQLSSLQSEVNEQVKYLSSGKRVLTAKDDAVTYGTLAGYKDSLANIEKYQRNITLAENRNSLQDRTFANAEGLMQTFKQLLVQANNGSLSGQDLKALGAMGSNTQEQMLDIANTKDETGGYIFAGYQIDKRPFELSADNTVNYFGDNGIRELQISKNVMVETNQSGDDAFQKVGNVTGDFSPQYNSNTSGIKVNRAIIVDRGAYDTVTNPPNYNFNFSSPTDLTVTDSLGATVYTTAAYAPGQTVAFNGVEVQIDGNPLPGDDFDLAPEENISIFQTIKEAIDWMNTGTNPADPIVHSLKYDELLLQVNNALNHITTRQSDAGVRMQLIESQENNHLDNELIIASSRSNLEDLDFAKAIASFEQSQTALQASQQSFIQIKDLSLFNYI
jgi:flagellar hook-associated protein 3 FlgL